MPYTAQLARLSALLLIAGAAQAQDAPTAQLKLETVTPSVELCREAVESGRIIKSDETGTYVLTRYHLVRLTIDGQHLTCTAQFITNP